MLKGIDLIALAKKISANKELKHDLIADTRGLDLRVDADRKVLLSVPDHGTFPILPVAHDQIAARAEIPGRYYDRMLAQQPELLATNVKTWFQAKPERRLIRTLGGDARAFLSNRYQRIENEEISEVVLPILADIPDIQFVSTEITERRMYIQAVTPRIQGEVKKGDIVQAGVIISNSEVGLGSVTISPLVYRLACLNGMVVNDAKFQQRHVGARIDNTEALWSDEAKAADDKAVLLKVRDVVRSAVSDAGFGATLERMRGLTEMRLANGADPAKAVEVLAKKVGASEGERGGILTALIEGHDLTAWGFLNAVTHQAYTASSYDRSVELEQAGGALLSLAPTEWREILQAA